MLAAIQEIPLILLVIAEDELSLAVLQITCPVALVDIPICIFVNTVETLVVPKCAREGIAVKES